MTLSPRFTSIAWIVAGVLTLAGMLATPWEATTGTADYLTTLGSHATQGQVAAVLLHFGYLALVPAFFGLYWLLRDTPGRLRTAGGVLAVFGAIGLPGLLVVDFYAIALYENLPIDQAVKIEEAAAGMPGAAIVAMTAALPMMLGAILLFVAAARAKALPWWMAAVMAVSMVAPMAGAPALAIASGVGVMAVAVGIAVRLTRSGDRGPVVAATA